MAEEGTADVAALGQTQVTEQTAAGTTAAAQPTPPLVDSEGVLRENWRDTLPEEIRSESVFDRAKDFSGLMRSLASAEQMIGKEKVAIPNESSSPDEWDAFHKAGGRPDTVEEYGFVRPEEIPEVLWSNDRATRFMNVLHKAGASKKLADALFTEYKADYLQQMKDMVTDDELEMQTRKDELVADWGNTYVQREHLGNATIEIGADGDAELKQRVVEKFGKDPDFMRFTSNIGSKFSESKLITAPAVAGPSASDIDEQIAELQKSDAYNVRTNPGHKAALEKMTGLYKKKSALAGQPATRTV